MKKILLFLIFLSSQISFAQVFEKVIGFGLNIQKHNLIRTHDSGYILFAGDDLYGYGGKEMIKIDSLGNIEWAKKYDWGGYCATTLKDNKIAVYHSHYFFDWPDYVLTELEIFDSLGNALSGITIPESLFVQTVHPTSDGGTIAITGNFGGYPGGNLMMKSDSTGNFEWIKFIDSLNNYNHVTLADIVEAKAGGFIGIGNYMFPDTMGSATYTLIVRLNESGDTIWTRSFERIGDWVSAIKIFNARDNQFLVISEGFSQYASLILQLDSSGNISQVTAFPDTSHFVVSNFSLSADSNYIFSAFNYSKSFLLKTDTSIAPIWLRSFPSVSVEPQLIPENNGGYALSMLYGTQKILLIKTDSLGASSCDSIELLPQTFVPAIVSTPVYHSIHPLNYTNPTVSSAALATAYYDSSFSQVDLCLLLKNNESISEENRINIFPNPATTSFAVSNLQFANGTLEIYNLLGKKIYSTAYPRSLTVDCRPFPKGIYFVRLSNSEKQLTQKLIIE